MKKIPKNKIIAVAFFMALGVHGFILATPGGLWNFFNKDQLEEDLLIEIEIEKPRLLPKIDVIGEEKKLRKIKVPEDTKPRPVVEEEITDMLMKEKKINVKERVETVNPWNEEMFRYKDAIKQRIESCRRYPRSARRHKIEGITVLTFVVSKKGVVSSIKVVQSSGYKILDAEAAVTVKRVSPLPPIPPEIDLFQIDMEVAIVFTL